MTFNDYRVEGERNKLINKLCEILQRMSVHIQFPYPSSNLLF